MRSTILFSAALCTILVAGFGHTQDKAKQSAPPPPVIAPTEAQTPADELKTFHLPPHFEMQLVASEPDIHKPMNINFDARGRLWLTESVEYPFPVTAGKGRDAVKILEDFGPDGKARKITTFAGGLNIPIGVLPLPGAKPQDALVYSIPNIYRLRDTMGKGQADRRDVLYSAIGHDDTHGMTNAFTLGFDGWVYACHGFRNTSTLKGSDGQAITMNSGNVYRMKTDGSHLEQITHGQVNPFGLAFDPLGYLYSCDCHSQPIYQLIRGGYYPSFAKGHDGLGYGPEMYKNYRDSTAISGIAYYDADHFPKPYRDSCYIGDVVTNRVNEFRLEWTGSSPRGVLKYFLKSDDPWFRPVDIKLGPDGALYIADFYNRIIGHYEVDLKHPGRDRERGRIWRIVYKGPDGKNPLVAPRSDWTTAMVSDLVQDLAHPNLTVRMTAMNQLLERGAASTTVVQKMLATEATTTQRVHGLWVLERQGKLEEATLTSAATHAETPVRVHAQRLLAERKTLTDAELRLVLNGLKDADAHVKRAAVDALATHPDGANLRPLLDLRQAANNADTHLIYAIRVALREQLQVAETWAKLPGDLNERDAKVIADVSLAVPRIEAAAYLLKYFQRGKAERVRLPNLVHHIARYGDAEAASALMKAIREQFPKDLLQQAALFRSLERGTQEQGVALSAEVRQWAGELTDELLTSTTAATLQVGIELAGVLKLDRHLQRLIELATESKTPEASRNAALNALAAIDTRKHVATLAKALTDADAPIGVRENAANLLIRANQDETQAQLLLALPTAPARLQNVIAAGLAGSQTGAAKLLDAIAAGKASPRLLQERFVEVRLTQLNLPGIEERIAKLTAGLPPADKKLQDLLKKRRAGYLATKSEAQRGAVIFEKSCANCHQIAGKGAKVGPNLDGIGVRGLERLLEDTLDPNRNVDQAFRTTILNLKNGQVLTGLLLKQEGEVLILADAAGKEVRVPKNTIDDQQVSPLSPMPADFADKIPEKEFYDLLAYLLTQRAGGK